MFKIFVVTKYSGFNVTTMVVEFQNRQAANDAITRIEALNDANASQGMAGIISHSVAKLYDY